MPADLIVYALVAAGLVFWLRNILGTRNGEERQRENPLMRKMDDTASVPEGEREVSAEDLVREMAKIKDGKAVIANSSAEGGLLDIARADRGFDINFFMDGAQEAFAMIVECFAAGDRDALKELLGASVYGAFEGAITEREKRGEKQDTQIRAIRKAEIIESRLAGRTAFITIKFLAEETSVTRDSSGNIIDGNAERIVLMRDIWTFSRDIKSRDPRWVVIETRGDFEDDNNIIPNSN